MEDTIQGEPKALKGILKNNLRWGIKIMATKPDLATFAAFAQAIEPLEKESLHIQRKIRQAKSQRNFKALARYQKRAAQFQAHAQLLRQVLQAWGNAFFLACEVDRLQQERRVPRSVVFRKSYSSESWTERYS
jgi:hypothetical protein